MSVSDVRLTCRVLEWFSVTILVSALFRADTKAHNLSCPISCQCTSTEVLCGLQNFSVIPAISRTTHLLSLDLSANLISSVPNDSFTGLTNLRSLHLSHNLITMVEYYAFWNLEELQEVYLQGNKLASLDSQTFHNLPQLRVVNLSRNVLSSIPKDLFAHNHLLQIIDLGHNKIEDFSNETFRSLTFLQKLLLNGNCLKQLSVDLLTSLHSLIYLNIANAELEQVDEKTFYELSKLENLNLSGNRLSTLPSNVFQSLTNLEYVDLSKNNILVCNCRLQRSHYWVRKRRLAYLGVICENTESKQSNVTCVPVESQLVWRKKSPTEPFTHDDTSPHYDPLLGWYTAATLTGMLVAFLVCLLLDNLKRQFFKMRREKRIRAERYKCLQGFNDNGLTSSNLLDCENLMISGNETFLPRDSKSGIVIRVDDADDDIGEKNVEDQHLESCDTCALGTSRRSSVNPNHNTLSIDTLQNVETIVKDGGHDLANLADRRHSYIPVDIEASEVNLKLLDIHPDCPIHNPQIGSKLKTASEDESPC